VLSCGVCAIYVTLPACVSWQEPRKNSAKLLTLQHYGPIFPEPYQRLPEPHENGAKWLTLEHNGPVFADAYRMVFRNQGLLQDILVRVRNSRLWMTSINCCTNGGGFLTFRLIMVSTVVMYHAQFPTGSIYGMPAKKTDPPKRLYISKAGYHTTDENNLFLVLHPFRQVSIILLKMYYV